MKPPVRPLLFFFFLLPFPVRAVDCACNHADPATLDQRSCSLCREAEKQSSGVFFLKDANPRKPNRTLALPLQHGKGLQRLGDLSPQARADFWKAAIAKAEQLWPGGWGVAYNADTTRTQCHLHVHIGKLIDGVDESTGRLFSRPEEFPLPDAGVGLWVHPVSGGFHVHMDRETAEFVLVR
ncbi:MAG TPA: hypothetical protein VFA54_13950 [Bryobacterales bacterium]|jgi:diadenosine tetraphosphate (Ap4A) HIT family hydrolase|nr:hypothetical protein [Bryobacterales bacterium]